MSSTALLTGLAAQRPLRAARHAGGRPRRCAALQVQAQSGGFGEGLKRVAKQVQASLPVIGLISRLASPEGGVGSDMQAYPEFCRSVFEAAPMGFQIAVAELQKGNGKPCERRYILLVLWMARLGAGVIPGKSIVDAARRLRFSFDIEFEMERFEQNVKEVFQKYTYLERPQGSLQQQAEVAVDGLCRLCLNLPDGQPIPEGDAKLIADAAAGAFWDRPEEGRAAVAAAVASRGAREGAYAT